MDLRALSAKPAPGTTSEPFTAQVVRSDTSGVWVARLGQDTRHPLGPCYGATHLVAGDVEQLPAGALVLLVPTADGPWVAAHHQEP